MGKNGIKPVSYTHLDGSSFEENAVIKAKTVCELTNEVVLADDAGLEIDYLNGEPGIYSARYMGEDTSYRIKNQNLIDRLAGVPQEKRTARFVCAVAAAYPDGTVKTARGTMEGIIGYEERGENGFGYDLSLIHICGTGLPGLFRRWRIYGISGKKSCIFQLAIVK